MFLFALRADETKRMYTRKLKVFFDLLGLKGNIEQRAREFVVQAKRDQNWALGSIMRFMAFQKERTAKKEISASTCRNYYKPIKVFYEMNDIQINWKKVTRGLPRARRASIDRVPTVEEVKKIVGYPDRRIKPIVCTMISSGIRLGVWDSLRWGDIDAVIRNDKIVASRLVAYRGDAEQYLTFITSEAYCALKEWMDYREMAGETITRQSWVMRNLWDSEHYHHGLATHPEKLKSSGIKRLIERALWAQGIRRPLDVGEKRHEFQADHGFRKYFKTRSEQIMRPINVEILMGHSTGISDSYYKPTETELMEDYLKASEYLTIDESQRLSEQVAALSNRIESDKNFAARRADEMKAMSEKYDQKLAEMEEHIRLLMKWNNRGVTQNDR